MARTYRTRPSELLAIADSWAAYQVDRAVMVAGNAIEAKVAEAEAAALRAKGDPAAAARSALLRALEGEAPATPAKRRQGPRKRFRYDLGANPRVLGVVEG